MKAETTAASHSFVLPFVIYAALNVLFIFKNKLIYIYLFILNIIQYIEK